MKGRIVVFCMLLFLIASTLFYVYYKYERTNEIVELQYVNVSVLATVDGIPVVTGFSITRDGYYYSEGITLEAGAILMKVPLNSTYNIKSVNLVNQSFYTVTKNVNIRELKPYRVTLDIIPPGEISVSHSVIKVDSEIILNVTSVGPYNDMSYCLDWSSNFLWVKSLNDTATAKQYVPKYVKCYNTYKNIIDNSSLITLKYKEWDGLEPEDYVRIYFLDKNAENGTVVYDEIGGHDLEYIISNV